MNPHLTIFLSHLPVDTFMALNGATLQLRNGDVYFPFRQDSDFLYLTELSVPNMVLTIFGSEIILWREPITDKDMIWGSDKVCDTEMTRISGITDIRDISKFSEYMENKKNKEIEIDQIRSLIHSLRLIKTPDEIEKIRKAISVSQEAFAHIESIIKPGMYEYEIEAEIARFFRSYHLTEAYPSIVASGPNTCTLHYTKNTRQIVDDDLVLIDAGAEYMGYASDISRTIFVGENSSDRTRQVYAAVERVKGVAEKTLKPGITLLEYEFIVRSAMNQELISLGLIQSDASVNEIEILSKKYYPHRTSHFLGLDVHDVGSYTDILLCDMVLTIEPGIYIREEKIGVRIEDDYRIIENGCERLS